MKKKMKKSKLKNKSLGFKFCFWLSLIVVVFLIYIAISGWIEGGFALIATYFSLYAIPCFLILIWGIYGIVKLVKYLYRKNKCLLYTCIGIIIILISIFLIIGYCNTYKIYTLSDKDIYNSINGTEFLVNDNKLYYEVSRDNSFFTRKVFQNTLNYLDLKTNENKMLCDNVKDIYNFNFIYNNELYYYKYSENKPFKINLLTCEIKDLNLYKNKFISNVDDNNISYLYMSDVLKNHDSIIQYDVLKNEIINEVKISSYADYLIDYDNFNVFHFDRVVDENNLTTYELYMNDKLILSLRYDIVNLLFIDGDYIFIRVNFGDKQHLYIYNYKTDKLFMYPTVFNDTYDIISDNNDNYLVADNKVYKYNEDKEKFDFLFDITYKIYSSKIYIYHHGDKVIFKNEDNFTIYDSKTKESNEYLESYFSYDNVTRELYVLNKDGIKKLIKYKIILK